MVKFNLDSPVFDDAFTIIDYFGSGHYFPFAYSGPAHELLGCRTGAWLGNNLNCSPVYDIFGSDAVEFLNYVCVNRDFSAMKEGSSRHAIICNEKGQMLADGVLLKIGEDRFRTYWLGPVIAYFASISNLDVNYEDLNGSEYFFQVDGPKSLEILEAACQCDLHDLKFAQNRVVKIHGMDMRVHRLGMSGALAYEVHGPVADADEVYRIIREAGRKFDIRPQGFGTYCTNHTQGGYPNQYIHYMYPIWDDPNMAAFCKQTKLTWIGSCGNNDNAHYVTPYDCGWGGRVNFNHDFRGKEALEQISQNPPRTPVTLEWNVEDISDVFASQFMGKGVEPYYPISIHLDMNLGQMPIGPSHHADRVLANGQDIGVSAGRIHDYYHQKMISLCFINKEYAKEGTDVVVLWGPPGRRQKEIRAKVAAFPYFNEEYRNETYDVENIPHPSF